MNTKKQLDRQAIVQTIKEVAHIYKDKLVGKTFLYVFDNRYIEVIFKAENFRHLTGVDTTVSAKRFYQLAIQNRLESTQISFSDRHPIGLCRRKLKHITDLADLTVSESFMLEEITTNSYTYKFGTTNLRFTLCLGEDFDENHQLKSSSYIVQSLRDEDCFQKSRNVYTVTHILSKANDVKQYSELLFMDKSAATFPDSVIPLLSPELSNLISCGK